MKHNTFSVSLCVFLGLVLGMVFMLTGSLTPAYAQATAQATTTAPVVETTAESATVSTAIGSRLATVSQLETAGNKVAALVAYIQAMDFAAERHPAEFMTVFAQADHMRVLLNDIASNVETLHALDAQMPTWDNLKSAHGRALLLKFMMARARFCKQNGNAAGLAQYSAICRDLAWRMVDSYPRSFASRDAIDILSKTEVATDGQTPSRQLADYVQTAAPSYVTYLVAARAMDSAMSAGDMPTVKTISERMTAIYEQGGLDEVLADPCTETVRKAETEYSVAMAYSTSDRHAEALDCCEHIQTTYGGMAQKDANNEKAEPNIILRNTAYMQACLTAQANIGRPDKALAAYDTFLTRYPTHDLSAKVLGFKAQVHENNGRQLEALACLQEAVRIAPYSEGGMEAAAKRGQLLNKSTQTTSQPAEK